MPALVKLLAAAAPAAEPDADLLARFVATRDDGAFAELVRRHGPAVYGTCRRLVGPSAADDAFQATFLVLAARAGAVRKAASVGSWLVGVAGRVARRMRLRDQRVEARRQVADPDQHPAPGLSPDLSLLSSDLCSTLADEFTRLPDRLRAAAVACLVDGHTQEQAAAVLGWSSRTVRRRLDEAKGLLRTRLERRGVTPALAAAAVTAAGEAAALPTGLARRATDAATLFLAGGGADARAAALAHGVIGTMTTIRSTTAAAACAAVLAGLGIGWAGDAPQPLAPKGKPTAKVEPDRIPPPAAPKAPPSVAAYTHRTANFVVEAPTEAVARALGEEFERQRKAAAVEWLGTELPVWKTPVAVRVEAHPSGDYLSGTIRFSAVPGAEIESGISGRLDVLLNRDARRWPTQYVLMTQSRGYLPRWAEDAVARLDDPDAERQTAVGGARRQLEDGSALRLAALFKMKAPPPGTPTADQSFAVARFLLERAPDRRVAVFEGGSIGLLDAPPALAPGQSAAKHGLFTFMLIGAHGHWEIAAKDVYGFASLDEMERAWISWVRAQPGPPARPADPLRIPAGDARPLPAAPKAATPAPHTHRTANYVVEAPTAAAARALGDEFERQRKATAGEWIGTELPAWKEPVTVRVEPHRTAGWYTGEVRFRGVKGGEYDTTIHGGLDALLGVEAPRHAVRHVLTTRLGRRLPRWVDSAIEAGGGERPEVAYARCFGHLYDGRALRLTTLFAGAGEKSDWNVYEAQGYAVAKFLLTRAGDPGAVPPAAAGSRVARLLDGSPDTPRGRLLAFVTAGATGNTVAGWDAAAKDVYGFDSVDRMEAAWLDWLRRNPPPQGEPNPPDPLRIPPTELTTPRAEPEAAGGATHRTTNFAVSAPSAKTAATVAEATERHRRELAKRWLGKELPDAKGPIPVKVVLTAGGAGGATTFTFSAADGKTPPGVTSTAMELHGPLNQLLGSNVPHEVMHVVLATHFGRPLPRWADEGIAVLAESDAEQKNHDVRARELLNAGRAIRLGTLLRMTEYPRDMIVLYAQGYSVCRFLLARGAADPHPGSPPDLRAHKTVQYTTAAGTHEARIARGDREPALLAFLALGMSENSAESWALAAKEVYGFDSLDALEQAWIDSLRPPPAPPGAAPTP